MIVSMTCWKPSGATADISCWKRPQFHSLHSIYRQHNGFASAKWSHFPFIYDELLLQIYKDAINVGKSCLQVSRRRRPRMFQIGIENGGSLQLYNTYFHGLVDIVGIDINPDVKRLIEGTDFGKLSHIQIFTANGFNVTEIQEIFGDAPNPPSKIIESIAHQLELGNEITITSKTDNYVVEHTPNISASTTDESSGGTLLNGTYTAEDTPEPSSKGFDLIIDDSSHINSEVIATFQLFFQYLNPGGLYIVESAYTTYSHKPPYNGGYGHSTSTFAYFNNLIDRIHNFPLDDPKLNGTTLPSDMFLHEMYMYEWVQSIDFHESIVVIRKAAKPKVPKGYCRVIIGEIEPVTTLGEDKTWIPRYDKYCLRKFA